jgi:ClpP class serine protease
MVLYNIIYSNEDRGFVMVDEECGKKDPVISRIMAERNQGQETRIPFFEKIEEILGIPIITFFTSFRFPVGIEDSDVDMLAGFLQMLDLSKGFALMINSPGGDGIAAERMINVAKNFSGTGEFVVIVPGKAKSAATMISLGASKIYMGPTSELGPIDPQISLAGEMMGLVG